MIRRTSRIPGNGGQGRSVETGLALAFLRRSSICVSASPLALNRWCEWCSGIRRDRCPVRAWITCFGLIARAGRVGHGVTILIER